MVASIHIHHNLQLNHTKKYSMYCRSLSLFAVIIAFGFLCVNAQDTGVLIMAHGGSEEWNQQVKEAAKPLEKEYAVEFAWGMANAVTLHHGIKALEKKGVSNIVAIPLFISSYSPIIRQTEYLFGIRDSLADRPMPLMHHTEEYVEMTGAEVDSTDYFRGMLMPPNLQPLRFDTEIVMTSALNDHEVVAKILMERIEKMSENPATETVVLAAHGPNRPSDNEKWVTTMESLIEKIYAMRETNEEQSFKQIFGVTVRDDASEEVFNQAKAQLRTLVRQAGLNGEVIVVPLFLSSGGREQAVADRLEGIDFKWNGETLLPHPLLTEFLQSSVRGVLTAQPSTSLQ